MHSDFQAQLATITTWLDGRAVEPGLAEALSEHFPPAGPEFQALALACQRGVQEGWLASRGEPPLRWGRVIKPGPATHGFSVDIVLMTEVVGPHHAHPLGEIDMIVPLDPDARFDGAAAGWMVYGPGSAHSPTVTGGSAIVLYLLPAGEIEFANA
jgi:hypothetical protein